MAKEIPSCEQIDELLRFRERFEEPDRTYIKEWASSQRTTSGAITFPYPVYDNDVVAFFALASQSQWSDYRYEPGAASQMLEDDALIAQCSLADIKTMLTYCVRGERFSDGHWGAVLSSGRISALLRRLAVLRDELC